MPLCACEYDELRLRLGPGDAGGYRVLASTGSAEVCGRFELQLSDGDLDGVPTRTDSPARGGLATRFPSLTEAERLGGRLFNALFRDRIGGLYHEALATARGADKGLRITLCLSDAPNLIDVPWEYLFDAPHFLAISAYTPVVRYLDLPRGPRPLAIEPPLRILGVVSNPADRAPLDVESERANLESALSGLVQIGTVALQWLEQPTLGGLLRALQTGTFHAIHYVGHGRFDGKSQRGYLVLEDPSGWSKEVSGDQLATVLRDFTSLRLAVLNACEGARTGSGDPCSGVAQSLVQREIPAVIAMQSEITDDAAIVFANGFYSAIATGVPVDAALAIARLAMFAECSDAAEWGTPALFMRVPDGRIFDLAPEPTPNKRQPRAPNRRRRRRTPERATDRSTAPRPSRAHYRAVATPLVGRRAVATRLRSRYPDLATAMAERELLLVLDSFEQLIAAEDHVSELLEAAASLDVLELAAAHAALLLDWSYHLLSLAEQQLYGRSSAQHPPGSRLIAPVGWPRVQPDASTGGAASRSA